MSKPRVIGKILIYAIINVVLIVSIIILVERAFPALNIQLAVNFVFYLGSAIIQAYAAIIAIPFTIAVIHVQKMYGTYAIRALIKTLALPLIAYAIVVTVVICALLIGSTYYFTQSNAWRFADLALLIGAALIPLPFFGDYLIELFTFRSARIIKYFLDKKKVKQYLNEKKYQELNDKLREIFNLLGTCAKDENTRAEFSENAEKLAEILDEIAKYIEKHRDQLVEYTLYSQLLPLGYFNDYIVGTIKTLNPQSILVIENGIRKLLKSMNNIIVTALTSELYIEFPYFVKGLRDLTEYLVENSRIRMATSMITMLLNELIRGEGKTIDKLQEIITKNPSNYSSDLLKSYGRNYDLFIDYVSAIICSTLSALTDSLKGKGINKIKDFDVWLFMQYILLQVNRYPILLTGYSFSGECIRNLVELIMKQDKASRPKFLALLIGSLIGLDIIKECYLNEEDKLVIEESNKIYLMASEILKATKRSGMWIQEYPNGDLKLMFDGLSSSIIVFNRDIREIEFPCNIREEMKRLQELGFDVRYFSHHSAKR